MSQPNSLQSIVIYRDAKSSGLSISWDEANEIANIRFKEFAQRLNVEVQINFQELWSLSTRTGRPLRAKEN